MLLIILKRWIDFFKQGKTTIPWRSVLTKRFDINGGEAVRNSFHVLVDTEEPIVCENSRSNARSGHGYDAFLSTKQWGDRSEP